MGPRPGIVTQLCLKLGMLFPCALLSACDCPLEPPFLGLIDPSHTFMPREQVFSVPEAFFDSHAAFFLPFSLIFLKITKITLPQTLCKLR